MEIEEVHEIISSWQRDYPWVLNVLSRVLNSSKLDAGFALTAFWLPRLYLPFSGLIWYRAVRNVNKNETFEKPGSTFSFFLNIPESCLRKTICLAHNHHSLLSLPGSSECLGDLCLASGVARFWTLLRGQGSSDLSPSFSNLVCPQCPQLCLS